MNQRMREQLLGYLLGALEGAEREEVERCLACNAHWRMELDSLQSRLKPLADRGQEFEPPAGLADQTCALVQQCQEPLQAAPKRPSNASRRPPLVQVSRWSLADMIVAAGVSLVAAMLFFPAIFHSRYVAQLNACQNNLRQIGTALADYSDKVGEGRIPQVPSRGNRAFAGVYAPILFDYGYLTEPRVLVCPASQLAARMTQYHVPKLVEIDTSDQRSIALLQQSAGGSYGYSLGVVVEGKHRAPRCHGRFFFAVMADMPVPSPAPSLTTNHGTRGCNVLFEDGHVTYTEIQDFGLRLDDPFRNRRGIVEAGLDENDAVVAESSSPPFRFATPALASPL